MLRLLRLIPACLAFAAAFAAGDARAAAGAWAATERVEARLVSAVEGAGELQTLPLGLELKLKPGWKTYWRSPGDAGLPPQLDWSGSQNVESAQILYPAPKRVTLLGLQTYGYADHVVLPLMAEASRPGKPLEAKVAATILVCEKICVPESFELALSLPAGPATPSPEAQLLARFRSAVPGDGAVSGLRIERVSETRVGELPALSVEIASSGPLKSPDVFVETDPALTLGAPSFMAEGGRTEVLIPLLKPLPPGTRLAGREATLTAVDGDRASERRLTIEPGTGATGGGGASLLAMIGLAFLGGLILNLMPCVLPVLSLKLFSLAKFGGAAPREVRAGFLASAAGVVASFLAIAAALIALQAAGRTIGWGIQFQQPAFIAAMVVTLTLFACNLWGFFEIPLPGLVSSGAGRVEDRGGLAGHFGTGVLATLLATPCSAPFLGTAVGFALASGAAATLAIFTALGFGVAAPYLAVAAFPRLARLVPKPGRWMGVLRAALGFALILTAIWLMSVLLALSGVAATVAVAALMLASVAALGLRRRAPASLRGAAPAFVAALALAAVLVPASGSGMLAPNGAGPERIAWQGFDRARVRSLVAQGQTVLVDVTADWCVTCQANKRLVLNREPVAARLGAVTAMKADWTRPDPAISAYLAENGRYGIPFNAVYGPGAPTGIVLPELLTAEAVTDALDKAGGERSAAR